MTQFFSQSIGNQQIYVLHGLGGAGKTQITLKFINKSSHFTDKFFLDGSTAETIETGLKNIALAKNSGNLSQDALKWLTNNHEDWLLFYDNADDPKLDLKRFIPQCNHGNIIITTRNPALRGYAGSHFAVSDMEENDAVALLLKSAAQEIVPLNKEIAAKIVKELCYLPLAIVQAGAFILQSEALDSYLDIYMKNRAQLLSEKPAQSYDNYAWTVYTTWQMSFDQLSPPAAAFLQLCSFLHRDGISEDIFSRAAAYKFQMAIPSREELKKPLEFLAQFTEPAGEWDTLRFLKVTNEIKAYSLMTFDPKRNSFSIHPLVHGWSQTTITDEQSYHSIMAAIMGMSIAEIPYDHRQLASLSLISHINFLRHVKQDVTVDFGSQYGIIYYHAGHYEEAKRLYLGQLSKQKQVLGDDHPHTLWVMEYLALTYEGLGQYKQAEELQVVVLEKQKLVLGDHHPHTLRAMGSLASTYHHLGKFHKAEELEVVVLDEWKQDLGDGHPDTLHVMGNLASTYQVLGKFHMAEELQVVVLEKQKQVLGHDHPDTLRAMDSLASTYWHLGKFQQAEELEVIVLEKRKQVLGDDHPDTLQAMGNLAATYNHLGEFQQAEELEVIVLEKRKQVLGDDHPETLRAMGNLGCTYHRLRQFQRAEELDVIVLEKSKMVLGDNHRDTLQAMRNLASTYHCLDKLSEAEELETYVHDYEKALEGSVNENSEGSDKEGSEDLTQL
ncbi:P-loop containing nucleoside triphosphate hydrolase protein [Mycena leptocephala]|nr:P-loop containing nucleoside triphosphate hydrolase protein [Mycena leptocephala]